jgi:hypothetical protein
MLGALTPTVRLRFSPRNTRSIRQAVRSFGIAGRLAPNNNRDASARDSRNAYLSLVADPGNEPTANVHANFCNHLLRGRQGNDAGFEPQGKLDLATIGINKLPNLHACGDFLR